MSEYGPGMYRGGTYKGGELNGSISRAVAEGVQQRRQDGMQKAWRESSERTARLNARPRLLKCIGALVSETVDVLKQHHVPTDWWLNIETRSGKKDVPAWTLDHKDETSAKRTGRAIREYEEYTVTTTRTSLLLAQNRRLYTLTTGLSETRSAGYSTSHLSEPVLGNHEGGEVLMLSDDELVPLESIRPGVSDDVQPQVTYWRDRLTADAIKLIA